MSKNINLCEILKGHEGEVFYSPCCGYIELTKIGNYILYFDDTFKTNAQGKINDRGECIIFPSKEQRDWNKWLEEQKHKVPKTWSELYNINSCTIYNLSKIDEVGCVIEITGTPIEKSALALLKIHQLIEVGYGGSLTDEEWYSSNPKWIIAEHSKEEFVAVCVRNQQHRLHIAFHTKEQAEEFLSKPENVELLKDYFMI